jgi:CRP-like cAMP-binding protein
MVPADCLARYPLFALLGHQGLAAWAACGKVQTAAAGETIFEAGSPGTWAFLVLEGQVRVLRSSSGENDVSVGVFGPGEVFGEYALLPPHLNTATCRTVRSARLLRLPLLPLQTFTKRPEIRPSLKNWLRLNLLVGFLRERTFLGFMSATSSLPLLERCREISYPDGHTIQADGVGDDRWHFIQAGQVVLHEGGSTRLLSPGDCFGERALLGQSGLPVAISQGDVRCLTLLRTDFQPAAAVSGPGSLQTVLAGRRMTTFPWIGQQEAGDCGVASLTMVARCHDREEAIEDIRRLVKPGEEGATLLDLHKAALALGMVCNAVRVDASRVVELALPAVAHLSEGHYVTVYSASPDGVVVGDPASAIVTWSTAFFHQCCSGHLLVFGATASRSE